MQEEEWFKDWFDSPYYHLLYQHRSETEANDFVQKIVSHLKLGSNTSLLDLACGKGRHSIAFASSGLDVVGLDLAASSIEHALKYQHDKLHFYVHDMRKLFRTNYFDVVCNLFTSFGYFLYPHEHQLVARNMSLALKPDGILMIDFVNRAFARKNILANSLEIINKEGVKFEIKRSYTDTRVEKEIHIQDQEKQFSFKETLASFTLEEMKQLFLHAGLTLQHVYGDYHLSAYNEEESPRMILQFKKVV